MSRHSQHINNFTRSSCQSLYTISIGLGDLKLSFNESQGHRHNQSQGFIDEISSTTSCYVSLESALFQR